VRNRGLIVAALTCSLSSFVSAQAARPEAGDGTTSSSSAPSDADTRTQYPAFLANSYFSIAAGYIDYRFSPRQLERGYLVESIDVPHLAARAILFGHQFSKYVSAQASYARPVRWVAYRHINGTDSDRLVWMAFGGVTLTARAPVTGRVSLYGEGGLGVTSRHGFEIDAASVVRDAIFASVLLEAASNTVWI